MPEKHGMVWWTELMTRDVKAAAAYYSKVCGWTFDTMPMEGSGGDYHIGKAGGTPIVGIMDMTQMPDAEGKPPHWFSYFAVDDVDAAVSATISEGGQVLRDPFDMPGIGRIAMLLDPTGAAMGMITPAEQS